MTPETATIYFLLVALIGALVLLYNPEPPTA